MEWYEILIAFFAIICICGVLVFITLIDYKFRYRKLEVDNQKFNDLQCDLMHIYSVLDEINNKIKE